jgi:hypothetical protein
MISSRFCNPIVGTTRRAEIGEKARWKAGLED